MDILKDLFIEVVLEPVEVYEGVAALIDDYVIEVSHTVPDEFVLFLDFLDYFQELAFFLFGE